jgi:hypothetical protein
MTEKNTTTPPPTCIIGDVRVGFYDHSIGNFAKRFLGIDPEDLIIKIPCEIKKEVLSFFEKDLINLTIVPGGPLKHVKILTPRGYDHGINYVTGGMLYAVCPFQENGETNYRLYPIYYRGTFEEEQARRKDRINKGAPKYVRDEWRKNPLNKETFPKYRVLMANTIWVIDIVLREIIADNLGPSLIQFLGVEGEKAVFT